MASRPQLPELDYEAMPAEEILGDVPRGLPGPRLARLLLPEGGVGAARHAARARPEGARLRARHARALPGDLRRLARGRAALRHAGRGLPGARRSAGRPRRTATSSGRATRRSAARSARSSRSAARSPDLDGWITGLRRDQSPTRANAPKVGWDETHELWKANPLADWDDERCWDYIHERELPYNELHDRGYASIGCTHCTLPGAGREGRWAGARQDRVRPARRGRRRSEGA